MQNEILKFLTGCLYLLPLKPKYQLLIEMEKFPLTKHKVLILNYMLHIIAPPVSKNRKNCDRQKTKVSHIPAPSTEFTLSAAEWAQNRLSTGTSFTIAFIPNKLFSRQAKSFDFYTLFSTPSNKIANRKPEQIGNRSDCGDPLVAGPVLLIPDIPHPDFLVT
ncbi:MAG: hypothetical protein ACETWQ_10750 [Phycisphaerae bacterium]